MTDTGIIMRALEDIEKRALAAFPTDAHQYGWLTDLKSRVMLPLSGFDLSFDEVLAVTGLITDSGIDAGGAFLAGLGVGLRIAQIRARAAREAQA